MSSWSQEQLDIPDAFCLHSKWPQSPLEKKKGKLRTKVLTEVWEVWVQECALSCSGREHCLISAGRGHLPASSSGSAMGLCSCTELQVRCNVFQHFSPGKEAAGRKPLVSCTALSWAPIMQRWSRSYAKHIAVIAIFRQCLSCKMAEAGGRALQLECNPAASLLLSDLMGLASVCRICQSLLVKVWERCWTMLSCHRGALSGRTQHWGQGCRKVAQSACCVPLLVSDLETWFCDKTSMMALIYLRRRLICKYINLQVYRSNAGVLLIA